MSKRLSRVLSLFLVLICVLSMGMMAVTVNATQQLTADGAGKLANILAENVDGFTYKDSERTTGSANRDVNVTLGGIYYYDPNDGSMKIMELYDSLALDTNLFRFNYETFKYVDSTLQEATLATFARKIKDYGLAPKDKQAVYDEIRQNSSEATAAMIAVIIEDSKADMFGALTIFQPFSSLFGTIMGVGTLLLILLIVASTILDLAYIGLPVFRNFANSKSEGHGGGHGGSDKPSWVSADAYSVVQELEGGGGGHSGGGHGNSKYSNGYVIYFRRRALTYIVLAICLLYLVSGQLANVIAWLMNLVSGFKF